MPTWYIIRRSQPKSKRQIKFIEFFTPKKLFIREDNLRMWCSFSITLTCYFLCNLHVFTMHTNIVFCMMYTLHTFTLCRSFRTSFYGCMQIYRRRDQPWYALWSTIYFDKSYCIGSILKSFQLTFLSVVQRHAHIIVIGTLCHPENSRARVIYGQLGLLTPIRRFKSTSKQHNQYSEFRAMLQPFWHEHS